MLRHWIACVLALAAVALPDDAGASEQAKEAAASAFPSAADAQSEGSARMQALDGGAARSSRDDVIRLAQVTGGGSLTVQPATAGACPAGTVFFPGQSVRLIGSGFAAGTVIQVFFAYDGGDSVLIDTTSADGSGALDSTVMIPSDVSAPAAGMFKVFGNTPGGERLGLTALIQIAPSPGGDTDGDLIPDVCDNCPAVANPGQENDDSDAFGNACDPCPHDANNDSDGDGLCGDVDACPFDPDNDADSDGVCGNEDNCPNVANPNQLDQDHNGIGDACQT